MSVTASLLCFGCFAAGKHVDGCFFGNIVSIDLHGSLTHITDLLSRALSRLWQEFDVFVSLWKKCHYFRVFIVSQRLLLFVRTAINRPI